MKSDSGSGILFFLFIIGFIVLFFVSKKFFPILSTILFIFAVIVILLIVLLVVLVIYFSNSKPKINKGNTTTDATDTILTKGRENLMEIRRLAMRIRNMQIRSTNEQICRTIDKILRTLKEQPEDIPRVRQFLNYYLPTLKSILTKYIKLQESGVPAEDITQNTIKHMNDIKTAMDKQYANLFNDDILDMSVEMKALTIACKRDGLLSDEDFKATESEVNS